MADDPAGYSVWGEGMGWILRLVETDPAGRRRSVDVMEIDRPGDLAEIGDLGLSMAEGKRLLERVQQEIVAAQAREQAGRRPRCGACGARCWAKDYRTRQVDTAFGRVAVRLSRFRCAGCGETMAGVDWPSHCRSTPELDRLRAYLSALMSYRSAAAVLKALLPVDGGGRPETLRNHTLRVGAELRHSPLPMPLAASAELSLSVDSTFIRSCEPGERQLEVQVGNVETRAGRRHVFAAVTKSDTEIAKVIERRLAEAGRTADTRLEAFTDGCAGLRMLLTDIGIEEPPILDWFHIAMGLQHLRQAAQGLPTCDQAQSEAKGVIIEAIERLRWRLWHGKAADARATIDCIRGVMRAYRDQQAQWRKHGAARQFWAALLGFDGYLRGQSAWLVNYAERHRAGLRVGTSITEGAANHLVNRRMNKSQQMRWSRRGADLLLQVRCAVYNGQIAPDLTQSTCGSPGNLVSIRDGAVSVSSCRRARKPPEARDSPRAARRARSPTSSTLPRRSPRRCARGERGCTRAAA
jgi:hypothetical protein